MSESEKDAFVAKVRVMGRSMPEKQQSQMVFQASLDMGDQDMILAAQPNLHPDWSGSPVQTGDQPFDATVYRLDGEAILFSDVWHKSQLNVIAFGSVTCPTWRSKLSELKAFREKCEGLAHFIVVYTKEAHTEDGWPVDSNIPLGLSCNQPNSLKERLVLANKLQEMFAEDLNGWELVIDGMEDSLCKAYDTLPIRLYVIDDIVRFQGGIGPFFFDVEHTDEALKDIASF